MLYSTVRIAPRLSKLGISLSGAERIVWQAMAGSTPSTAIAAKRRRRRR